MLIRHKLILNTALVAVAMLVLSGLFLYSNQVSRHLTEAQRNVDGLEIAMLNLRRAEKDFLIRKDPAFVTRFNEVLTNFHQLNQTLGQDDNLSAVQGELTRLDQQMGAYGKAFNDLVAQQQIIGLGPEDGLYGRLRTAVHQVEEGLKQLDEQGLLITMLQLRRAEKDFMLRSDIQYLERFQTLHKDFQQRLATLPEADRGKLEQASEQYRQDFVALVQGMQVLGLSEDEGLRNEMRGLVHQTEQGFTAVGKHIADELVRQTSRLNTLMLVCGGIIIVLIGIMSVLLGRSIDRPISRVNDTVNRIRQDNDLRLKIELQGADEMAQLAGNLDVMLGGFRHLIGDVKQSVHTLTEAADHLSGNVRRKLRQAQRAAEQDPAFAVNVEALTAAQPKDLDASEIEVRLGATWIDKKYIQQFMFELLEPPLYARRSLEVNYSEFTAEWNISGKNSIPYNDINARMTYGTDCANAYKILEDTLNLRDVRIYDTVRDADGKEKRVLNSKETTLAQQKQQAIRDAFRDWIWRDPDRRHTLVARYNELFNSTRPREYDGSHITFAGMNPEIRLREHQLNAVAHVLYGGNTLLAHEVGAGKSATRS